jgi:hypothetical protein
MTTQSSDSPIIPFPGLFTPSSGDEECFILIDPDTGLFSEHHDGYKVTEELLERAAILGPSATLLEKTDEGWSPC